MHVIPVCPSNRSDQGYKQRLPRMRSGKQAGQPLRLFLAGGHIQGYIESFPRIGGEGNGLAVEKGVFRPTQAVFQNKGCACNAHNSRGLVNQGLLFSGNAKVYGGVGTHDVRLVSSVGGNPSLSAQREHVCQGKQKAAFFVVAQARFLREIYICFYAQFWSVTDNAQLSGISTKIQQHTIKTALAVGIFVGRINFYIFLIQ